MDSEYFNTAAIKVEAIIKNRPYSNLNQVAELIAGPFGSAITVEDYVSDKVYRYIRGKDIQNFFVDKNDPIFIDQKLFNSLRQFHLKEKDILVTVVGVKFGQVAILSKEECPAVFSCKSTLIRTEKINRFYLVAFLLCKHGHILIRRAQRGMAQPGINLLDLATIPIPKASKNFAQRIEECVIKAEKNEKESILMFEKAEKTLLKTLGAIDFKPSSDSINHKTFKESFLKTGRIDAEYYQKKYDDYLSLIYNYAKGFENLETVCTLKDSNYTPIDDEFYKYIELSNIGKTGQVVGCSHEYGKDLPSRARRKVNTGDVLISSIEGSLQSCAIIKEQYDNALCSTGFYVLNSKKINPETLVVLFKSEPMQNILKQSCSGTILTAINKTELLNIPIPLIETTEQEYIAKLVGDSIRQKVESERLIEVAKRAIEISIEENEEKAIKYLNDSY